MRDLSNARNPGEDVYGQRVRLYDQMTKQLQELVGIRRHMFEQNRLQSGCAVGRNEYRRDDGRLHGTIFVTPELQRSQWTVEHL